MKRRRLSAIRLYGSIQIVLAGSRSYSYGQTKFILDPLGEDSVAFRVPSFGGPTAAEIYNNEVLELIFAEKRFNRAPVVFGNNKIACTS